MALASRALAGAVFLCWVAAGADLPRGQVVPRVDIAGTAGQSYALYLPKNFTTERQWPVLLCLDPAARGVVPVERFAVAAEKYGFVVVGSNNSRNGPMAVSAQAIQFLTDEVKRRFAPKADGWFAAGFSGGSRVALSWAQAAGLNGVIADGAAFGQSGIPKQRPFKVYAVAGRDDFNYHELHQMAVELGARGWPVRFAEFDGGHEWLPAELADEGLRFLSGQLAAEAPVESKEEKKMADRFARMTAELAGADAETQKSIVGGWKKRAAKPDGRVERQTLGWAFIRAVETWRAMMAERKYLEAAQMADMAVAVRPEAANAWLAVAEAQTELGDKKRARVAVERAVELGSKETERVEALRLRVAR